MIVSMNLLKNELLEYGFDENLIEKVLQSKKYKRIISRHKNIKFNFEQFADINFCNNIYEKYRIPIYKLAMLFGVSDTTLREYMIRYGAKMKGHCVGYNSHNNYFEHIDTKDQAYFLGLLAADGSVINQNKSYSVSISLMDTDVYMLDKFIAYANLYNIKKYYRVRTVGKNAYSIFINSSKMANDLSQYGIIPNKSHLDSIFLPNLENELISHFIRGYFDGDGIAKSNGYLGFCGSKTIIQQINAFIVNTCNVTNNKICYNKSNHIYYIQWGKINDVKNVANFLYNNSDDLFLTRKKEKIYSRF